MTRRNQGCPIIGRLAPPLHFLEHCVRIGFAARGAQSLFIIDPGEHDHRGARIVAKEPTEAAPDLRDLRAPPTPMSGAKCIALPELIPGGIARHHVQNQLAQGTEQFDVGVAHVPRLVILFGTLRGPMQLLQLFNSKPESCSTTSARQVKAGTMQARL